MANQENRTLTDQFMLRMPDGMRDRIKRAAEANGRSMNSEILSVLQEAYPEPTADEIRELIRDGERALQAEDDPEIRRLMESFMNHLRHTIEGDD